MNELQISGKQKFMGKEIPVVLGGFGANKKCISDKTISEIHGMETYNVRARITDNLKRFQENLDLIDLKKVICTTNNNLLFELGYSQMQISKAEHIYLLSERGYAKLIKIMDTDLAWEIHDKLVDEYFEMRNQITQKLDSYMIENPIDRAERWIEEQKEKQLVIKENNILKPKAEYHDAVEASESSTGFGKFAGVLQNNKSVKIGRNKIMSWCRARGYLCSSDSLKNKPSQQMLQNGYMEYRENVNERNGKNYITYTPLLTGKGQIWLTKKILEEYE